jgi:hypothetical protein
MNNCFVIQDRKIETKIGVRRKGKEEKTGNWKSNLFKLTKKNPG